MSNRIIKNFTDEEYILTDLGDIIVPANGSIDVGGDEQRMIDLATSESLLKVMSLGVDKIVINDGTRDYDFSEGIDLIRKISTPWELDAMKRPVIRSESRRKNYDTVFMGVGDNVSTNAIGEGKDFFWDFSNVDDLVDAPEGYLRKRIDWKFCDLIYLKEGKLYYFNAPKGSYIDMYLITPAGYPYSIKTADSYGNVSSTYKIAIEDTIFVKWVCKKWIEGTVSSGDSLDTEASTENPAYSFFTWRAEITVPTTENYQDFHGNWYLQAYRSRSI